MRFQEDEVEMVWRNASWKKFFKKFILVFLHPQNSISYLNVNRQKFSPLIEKLMQVLKMFASLPS